MSHIKIKLSQVKFSVLPCFPSPPTNLYTHVSLSVRVGVSHEGPCAMLFRWALHASGTWCSVQVKRDRLVTIPNLGRDSSLDVTYG